MRLLLILSIYANHHGISSHLDHTSDLNNKHDDQLRTLKSNLEYAFLHVKDLEEKKKQLDLEILEHIMSAQRFNESEQKHQHNLEKNEANVVAKARLSAINVDCNQLKKAQAKNDDLAVRRKRIENIYASRSSGGSSLAVSSGLSLSASQFHGPCDTPTDFLSLICPTADQAETAWMTMLGGIQGSFVDVGGHHGNVRHLPPQLQHQYNLAQHQFELNMVLQSKAAALNMALQAKAVAENELILLKNQMTMLPMHNGFFLCHGQSMQPLGRMSLPGQHVQHLQQGGLQFMQPLGGMSLPGQHVQGAMSDLCCLQQHTHHNEREYFNQEDTSNLTSVPASCYAPSLD